MRCGVDDGGVAEAEGGDVMSGDVAVVGVGSWGINHVRTLLDLGVLGGVCDLDAGRVDGFRGSVRVVASTVADLLSDEGIRKVVVAVPAVRHYAVAKECLEADCDVLVEKPLATSVEDGQRLVDLAKSRGRVLMVGHVVLFDANFEVLRKRVGLVGEIQYVHTSRLNFGKVRTEESALWSLAPHDLSMIVELLGEVDDIHCTGSSSVTPGVQDIAMVTFRAGTARCSVHVSWLHPFKERRFVIVGAMGMLVLEESGVIFYPNRASNDGQGNIEMVRGNPEILSQKGPDQTPPLTQELRHFIQCSETRKRPLSDGQAGLEILRILSIADKHLLDEAKKDASPSYFAHATAVVDHGAKIGAGTKIWHFSHVCAGAVIGEKCNIGQNVYIAPSAKLGRNVKVQNNVSIYDGVECEDDVFLGPSCVFTNIKNPRSAIVRKGAYDQTKIARGATVGANATIVCGVSLGWHCFVGAGAVLTADVAPYRMVYGNPAVAKAWTSPLGYRLIEAESTDGPPFVMACSVTGQKFLRDENGLISEFTETQEVAFASSS